ncbi:MAG: ATP-binding protein [Sphingomonas fennica]
MTIVSVRRLPRPPRWRRRALLGWRAFGRSGRRRRIVPLLEAASLLCLVGMMVIAWRVLAGSGAPQRPLTPPMVALLLVANLVPALAFMVLIARRLAQRRVRRSALGGRGQLHVRLVATFSAIAAVPTLLVVIFASLLFQYGVEFWFSDRARIVLESADQVAQAYVEESQQRIIGDIVPMSQDMARVLDEVPIDDPRVGPFFARQLVTRLLDEAAIVAVAPDGTLRLLGGANLDKRPLEARVPEAVLPSLANGQPRATNVAGDRVESLILLDRRARTYLYAARFVDPLVLKQAQRSASALGAYQQLLARSRVLQLRFNIALFLVSLLIVAAAIWIALKVADRMVGPVGDLVLAARAVAAGDFSVRVPARLAQDEVGTLAAAFNRMTRRIEEQTASLVAANRQLDERRGFSEAVLSAVSAGVVSLDRERRITLLNASAVKLLGTGESPVGRPLAEVAPPLDATIASGEREAVVAIPVAGEARTLAVRLAPVDRGHVLTFDDITEQLADQRAAAWADVARRIAHEIKNPLTPIQLAAERLQRRYGREVQSDPAVFERLTQTIVRQVNDLRGMVNEFSAFARMPKPAFARDNPVEIARQALFLQEVAHPAITFRMDAPDPPPTMVCDRRQLGQALTNIVKNAVEAVEGRAGEGGAGRVHLSVRSEGERLTIEVADDGVGLPVERERLTEPYMTTRARGTGLGLAIVRKIVEEHAGTITFHDNPGGGAIVRLAFNLAQLEPLADEAAAAAPAEPDRLPELTRTRSA